MSTPPLLMIAEGRKPRLRKAPASRPLEITLHMSVAALLRKHARPDWLWTHIANGEMRDPATAKKLRAMGMRAGMPDFVLVPPTGRAHFLELKRKGETLSEAQEELRLWTIIHGIPHATAYTMAEALVVLDAWGCLAKGGAR